MRLEWLKNPAETIIKTRQHTATTMRRFIAHLDMDAFFVSVAIKRFPFLKNQAVVVGGAKVRLPSLKNAWAFDTLLNYQGRGVVCSASYNARRLGLRSGMALMSAAEILRQQQKNAALIPVLKEDNQKFSKAFKAAVLEITPEIEDVGIDEIYMDLSAFANPVLTAQKIQQNVFEKTGLTCSIGLSENKLMAKLASALQKPRGFTFLNLPQDLEQRVWQLPVGKINGIGKKTAEKLATFNILSIGDLAKANPDFLKENFGIRLGAWLFDAAWGKDFRAVKSLKKPHQSIGFETTFTRDMLLPNDRAFLSKTLESLCARVAERLTKEGCSAKSVSVKITFADFQKVERSMPFSTPTKNAQELCAAARRTLKYFDFKKRLRLLGITARRLQTAPTENCESLLPMLF